MSLFFRKPEVRSMSGWVDADGFRQGGDSTKANYLTPVFAAHRHIVDFVSTLPLDCYLKPDQGRRKQLALPRLAARHDDPGGIGLTSWIGQGVLGMASDGNAVGWNVSFDSDGFADDVIWLGRHDYQWVDTLNQWFVWGRPVPESRITHIPWIVPPGKRMGLSPVEHYAAVTEAGLAAQEYANMKRGGGMPPLDLQNSEKVLDPGEADKISERLVARLAQGKPFVHGKDWNLTAPTIPPNHAMFIETLKLTANQIAAIYGIDPTEIGGTATDSMTYSTQEGRQIRRASDMRPYIVRFERGISRLLPPREVVQFNIDATIRVDTKTRVEVEKIELDMGTRNVNEVREVEDREPVPGGDFYNIPTPNRDKTTRNEGDSA